MIAGEALVGGLAGLAVVGLGRSTTASEPGRSLITWVAIAGGPGFFVSRTRPRSL